MNTRPPASCYLYDRARYINVINSGLKREEVWKWIIRKGCGRKFRIVEYMYNSLKQQNTHHGWEAGPNTGTELHTLWHQRTSPRMKSSQSPIPWLGNLMYKLLRNWEHTWVESSNPQPPPSETSISGHICKAVKNLRRDNTIVILPVTRVMLQ